jgi:hypothetical protein
LGFFFFLSSEEKYKKGGTNHEKVCSGNGFSAFAVHQGRYKSKRVLFQRGDEPDAVSDK